jgi:hypothetical protein
MLLVISCSRCIFIECPEKTAYEISIDKNKSKFLSRSLKQQIPMHLMPLTSSVGCQVLQSAHYIHVLITSNHLSILYNLGLYCKDKLPSIYKNNICFFKEIFFLLAP